MPRRRLAHGTGLTQYQTPSRLSDTPARGYGAGVRHALFLLSLLLGLTLAVPAAPAAAQEAETAEERAERLREIEARREQNARDAERLRRRTEATAAAMRRLQASLVELAASLQEAEREVTTTEARIEALDAEAETLTTALMGRRRAVGEVLGALQMLERKRPPALLASPDDANRAAVAAVALAGVTPELQAEAERLAGDLDRIEVVRLRAERERRRLAEGEAALSERRALLEDSLAERERRQAADRTRLRRIEREDAALAAEATSLRALLDGIEARDEARAEADLPRPPPPSPRPRPLAGASDLPARFAEARAQLSPPVTGRVVRRFGERMGGGGQAQEMTVATRSGAVVVAPFGGRVKWAKPYGALGNIVILDVGQGYTLVLMGLGDFAVRRDDVVSPGEPLGQMPTGASPGLRLHLRRGGEVIDPEPWFRPGTLVG